MQAEVKQCLEFMNRRLVKMDWTHLVCVCKHSVYSHTYVHLICDKWGTPCVSDSLSDSIIINATKGSVWSEVFHSLVLLMILACVICVMIGSVNFLISLFLTQFFCFSIVRNLSSSYIIYFSIYVSTYAFLYIKYI